MLIGNLPVGWLSSER
ncbi:MAG: hypothetical protein LRY55_06205, partial [Leadbetterella sp.]|nr:hypothetical protein [Leadbetterella sp.]